MSSKQIFDSPQLLEETLVDLTEGTKYFPRKISRAAMERYVRRGSGSRGVILESVLICGKRMTSIQAIARFLRGQLQTEAERSHPKHSGMSNQELAEASRKYRLS